MSVNATEFNLLVLNKYFKVKHSVDASAGLSQRHKREAIILNL